MEQYPRRERSPVPLDRCNLARAFDFIGDRWSLLILRSVLYGVQRFDDLQAENAIPRSVLSARLKELREKGLLEHRPYKPESGRTRLEYVPTEKAKALVVAFIALTQWADDWLDEAADKPVTFAQVETAEELRVGLVNSAGKLVPIDEVVPVFSVSLASN